MNKYVKSFLHRGLVFGGFGPVICGIVYACLEGLVDGFSLSGTEAFVGIISTYILAFVHAGTSVFNQIESWPIAKALVFHLGSLYLAYAGAYIVNSWIPFEPIVLLIFTAVFILCYFAVWISVVIAIRATSRHFNTRIAGNEEK